MEYTSHRLLFMPPAINTHLVRFLSPNAETDIANPPAALGAVVKVEMGFQIGLVKGGAVFLCPQQLPGFLMVNAGKAPRSERERPADPFLSAAVAEKTERKTFLIRMVCCTLGQGYGHRERIEGRERPAYLLYCSG